MHCVAVRGGDEIFSSSGGIDLTVAEALFTKYLKEYGPVLPWNNAPLPAPEPRRPYHNCAEAHVWLELCGRSKDPKQFVIASFNGAGEFSAPCLNCEEWVHKAFRYVDSPSRHYAGHSKQKATYRA